MYNRKLHFILDIYLKVGGLPSAALGFSVVYPLDYAGKQGIVFFGGVIL